MKRLLSSLIALAFVVSLPAGSFAQSTGTTDRSGSDRGTSERRASDRSTTGRAKRDRPAWSNTQGLHETRDIIGAKVEAPDGKDLGKVEALLIDPKGGKVTHAVVGLGGVLGVGKEKVVVPYSELQMTGHEDGKKARVVIERSALEQAPKYVRASDRTPSASPATSRSTDSTRPDAKRDSEKK